MTTTISERLGQIVLYTLTEHDVKSIVLNRRNAGQAVASGNEPREGDTYPAMIVRDWGESVEVFEQGLKRGALGQMQMWQQANGLHDHGIGYPVEFKGMSQDRFEVWLEAWIADRRAERALVRPAVNLQVFLDGNDVYWATSRTQMPADVTNSRGYWHSAVTSAP